MAKLIHSLQVNGDERCIHISSRPNYDEKSQLACITVASVQGHMSENFRE